MAAISWCCHRANARQAQPNFTNCFPAAIRSNRQENWHGKYHGKFSICTGVLIGCYKEELYTELLDLLAYRELAESCQWEPQETAQQASPSILDVLTNAPKGFVNIRKRCSKQLYCHWRLAPPSAASVPRRFWRRACVLRWTTNASAG